ncbi:MAG: 30S ribosomal protein S8 [Candidatus Sericytochromatia bacterium]|nr:30S ribosomal protein S8 [Candidatus Sericytochromatia bacterium]
MPVTDPIADMLTCIRNANTANLGSTEFPNSKLKHEIARVLQSEGYIDGFELVNAESGKPRIRVDLKYVSGKRRVITGIKRISKPGLRVYVGKHDLPRVLGGLGIAILSTPRGVLTDRDCRKHGVGGEVLAYVW